MKALYENSCCICMGDTGFILLKYINIKIIAQILCSINTYSVLA